MTRQTCGGCGHPVDPTLPSCPLCCSQLVEETVEKFSINCLAVMANALCAWADTNAGHPEIPDSEIGAAVALGDGGIGHGGQQRFTEAETALIHKALTWYCDGKKGTLRELINSVHVHYTVDNR